MVVFDDEVYAIGGQAYLDSPLDIVEKFDGNDWRINSFLNVPRGYHKACVLSKWPVSLLGEKKLNKRKRINEFNKFWNNTDN